jgi:penicillin-binding protein 1A
MNPDANKKPNTGKRTTVTTRQTRAKKAVRILWKGFFICLGVFFLLLVAANFGLLGEMPSIEEIQNPSASLSSQVYAEDGTLMGKYYRQDRVNVEYKDISPHVVHALVATEDKRFYDHSGIDLKSVARAVAGFGQQGGASTLTMQTAKNLFTENWETRNFLLRGLQKIKEAIIAVKLERNFTKEEILTLYLNTVAFSDNVFGIRNAARTFFQKEPDRLNIEESAVLVGMVNGPGIYNPRRYPKRALDRRNLVIDRMVEKEYVSAGQAASLKQVPITLNYKKLDENAGLGPYFRMILGEYMKQWSKEHTNANGDNYDLYRDGLRIYTTINPRMQLYAEEAVGKHINYMQKILNSQSNIRNGSVWKGQKQQATLENAMKVSDRWKNLSKEGMEDDEIRKTFIQKVPMKVFAWNNSREKDTVMTPLDSIKYHRQMLQAGFMAMDPLSGEIKAWVGGIDFKNFKYDHVNANTRRQVGSTIKPLLYSLAIEEAGFTPETTVVDQQQSFGQYGVVPATSESCTGRTMPMGQALAFSRNCASAYIMKQLDNGGNNGAKRFAEFLKRCDLTSKIEAYPSVALGACEISLYEMMQAYSMFPGRGFNVKPMFITRIEDKNGNVLEQFMPQRKEIISDVAAYSVIRMMQGVTQFGTARRIWGYGVKGEIAGKTGTTNDNSDAWFMGYTPQLLAGVWVGCDDRFIRFNSTDVGQGSSAALPIWAYFYDKASSDPNCAIDTKAVFVKPEVMTNDINYDWMNGAPPDLGAEGEDVGNGDEEDYKLPTDIQPEYIGPESQLPVNADGTTTPIKKDDKKPKKDSSRNDGRAPSGIPANNTDPKKPPKAIMPRRTDSTERNK